MSNISLWPQMQVGVAILGVNTSGVAVPASPNSSNQIPLYTDIGSRCRGISTKRGKQYEMDMPRGQLNKWSFDNRDGLLDPGNSSSPYYPGLTTHKEIRWQTVRNPTQNILEPNIATGGDTYGTGYIFQIIGCTATSLNVVSSANSTLPLQGGVMYVSSYPNGSVAGSKGWAFGNGYLTAGSTYTFSVYANIPTTSLGFALTAKCYNASATQLSSTTGSTVTVGSSWTRLSVTFTVPTNTVGTVFTIANTAAATSTFSLCTDQFQLEAGSTPSAWTAPGSTNIHATNYIQSLETSYDPVTLMQLLDMTTQDQLGVLSQQLLLNVHGNEVQNLNPYAYWPLNDSGKSTTAGALMNPNTGIQQAPAYLVSYGAGSKPTFGGTSIVAGDPNGTCLTFDNTATNTAWTQLNLSTTIQAPNYTLGVNDVTVNLWFSSTQVPTIEADILAQTMINNNSDLSVALQPNGHLKFNVTYTTAGGSYDSIDSGYSVNDGKPHMVTCMIFNGLAQMALYIDGTLIGALSRTSAQAVGIGIVATRLGNGGANQLPYVGSVQHVAIFSYQLSPTQINNLYQSGSNGWSGDLTSTRFQRILGYSGTTISSVVPSDPWQTETGLYDSSGQSVLDALNLVAQDEQGNLYNRGDGFVALESRHGRWKILSPTWNIGDNGTTEIPYDKSVKTELDDVKVVNSVQANRVNGATQSVVDTTSIANHFYRAYPSSLVTKTATDADTANILQGIVWRYKNPMERLVQAQFQPASVGTSAGWSFVCGAEIGQRIRYNRRPPGAASKSLDAWIESISHDVVITDQAVSWVYSIEASPGLPGSSTPGLSAQQFVLTAARSTLKTSTLAGATSFVLNALSDAATNTSQSNGWTPSAITQITIWDGANTETLPVSSISATSVGYTQFTVTTSSGAGFAHSAGVTISEYVPQNGINTSWTYNTFDAASALDGSNILGY